GQSISIIIMSTPFINFGGYGSSLCRARTMCVLVVGLGGHPTSTGHRGIPGAPPKDPDPGSQKKAVAKDQDGRTAYHSEGREERNSGTGHYKHKVAAADPLPEQGFRSPVTFFVIIHQASGVWGPRAQPMGRLP
ncbi:hypothetical protein CI102_9987, partial [Trichoderma harzianum]